MRSPTRAVAVPVFSCLLGVTVAPAGEVRREGDHTLVWKEGVGTTPASPSPVAPDPDLEPGFPVQGVHGPGSYHGGPAIHTLVGNIDADPQLEIIRTALATGPLHAWNHDGTPVAGWPVSTVAGAGYPALGQLSAASAGREVFSGHWGNPGRLVAWAGSGSPLAGWPRNSANFVATPAALADVNGDGLDEAFLEEEDFRLHAYDAAANPLPGWPVYAALGTQERHTPAIADLDGDGVLEIVTVTGSSSGGTYMIAYRHSGETVAGFPVEVPGAYTDTFPAVADVDGDGALEIVVVGRSGGSTAAALVFSAAGVLERAIEAGTAVFYGTAPALADMNGDGTRDIVVQTNDGLYAWRGDGTLLPGWPVTWSGRWLGESAPVVGDVTGDGQPDVVVTTQVAGSSENGEVRLYDRLGVADPRFPKALPIGGGAVPALADIDLDGRNEIVVSGSFWSGSSGSYDMVWAYDLGNGPHGAVSWGQFMANAAHTGTGTTLIVDPTTLPSATAGVAYSQSFVQTGGIGAITWSLTGTLPTGMGFEGQTGVLSGTPTEIGSFPLAVTATDANGSQGRVSVTLGVVCPTITVFPAPLPLPTVGVFFSWSFLQMGGVGTITWSLTGALPPGVGFDTSTGVLSGTPTVAGAFPISVTATDANGCQGSVSLTLSVVTGLPFAPMALDLDASGNRVLEPGETVVMAPSWRNDTGVTLDTSGVVDSFVGPGDALYTISDAWADYGTVAAGATASCTGTGDCYGLTLATPTTRPQRHWDASVRELLPQGTRTWWLHVGHSFTDVPTSNPFYRFVEILLHKGITGGCGPDTYCPASSTTREQMAVFVLVAKEGASYSPPACSLPNLFSDVPETSPFCAFIEELAARGVVSGCGNGNYCPTSPVTRDQMAIFTLRTLDPTLVPPPCSPPNLFADVPETSPFCAWIEELASRGVVSGCGNGNYCPADPVTREQMGVFIGLTFSLTLYGP